MHREVEAQGGKQNKASEQGSDGVRAGEMARSRYDMRRKSADALGEGNDSKKILHGRSTDQVDGRDTDHQSLPDVVLYDEHGRRVHRDASVTNIDGEDDDDDEVIVVEEVLTEVLGQETVTRLSYY